MNGALADGFTTARVTRRISCLRRLVLELELAGLGRAPAGRDQLLVGERLLDVA